MKEKIWQTTLSKNDYDLFKELLGYVLDHPTPLQIEREDSVDFIVPQDLSIMKQSLLFKERKATVSIYKIAELLKIYLGDVIDCIEDLAIIIERLPSQQYSLLLSKFEKNMQTIAISEAIMAKRGRKASLITFIQQSALIWEHTPELGLYRE